MSAIDRSVAVSTVALLQRRDGMSQELFSAYWRDVHGVLAVRIPGFWSYVQNHLEAQGAAAADGFRMDGFAEVEFLSEADRQGLISSQVTQMILRDEPKVFSRTLLYNLAAGASRTLHGGGVPTQREPPASHVLLLQSPAGLATEAIEAALDGAVLPLLRETPQLTALRAHALASGDPGQWAVVGGVDNAVRGAQNSVVLQASWATPAAAEAALAQLAQRRDPAFAAVLHYRVRARYEMVIDGAPTHLGLRGLSALQTIEAAGADNQKQDDVISCIYGASAFGRRG